MQKNFASEFSMSSLFASQRKEFLIKQFPRPRGHVTLREAKQRKFSFSQRAAKLVPKQCPRGKSLPFLSAPLLGPWIFARIIAVKA